MKKNYTVLWSITFSYWNPINYIISDMNFHRWMNLIDKLNAKTCVEILYMVSRGLRGAPYWASIMPKGVSLSNSQCNSFPVPWSERKIFTLPDTFQYLHCNPGKLTHYNTWYFEKDHSLFLSRLNLIIQWNYLILFK